MLEGRGRLVWGHGEDYKVAPFTFPGITDIFMHLCLRKLNILFSFPMLSCNWDLPSPYFIFLAAFVFRSSHGESTNLPFL